MRTFSVTTLASFLVLSFISSVQAGVCNDGEVGVGVGQLCGDSPGLSLTLPPFTNKSTKQKVGDTGCGKQSGEIFANDCGIIAGQVDLGSETYCGAVYDNGASVTCDGNGTPTEVVTQGGNFGNCYDYTGSQPCGQYLNIQQVYYCCSRL